MQIRYEPLFRLRLEHNYFSEGNSPAISIVPTTETERIMQRLGIRMTARNYGVELFYNKGTMPEGQLLSIDAPVRLAFILRPTDPLFQNYTDLLPMMGGTSIRYLNNLSPQPDQPPGTFQVANGKNFTAHPRSFNIEVNTPGKPIALKDELENVLHTFLGSVDPADASPPISLLNDDGARIQLNLNGEPSGFYTLMEEDEILQQFILSPQNWTAGDVGLLSVYLGDTGAKGKHILIDGTVTPEDFNLTFAVRETKWRYYMIDNANIGYSNLQLLDSDSRLPLTPPAVGPTSKQLPDGSTAMVLTTPTAIPLRQRPGSRFLLSIKPTASERATTITVELPSADASRISRNDSLLPDAPEDPFFYSDMYVYL